MKTIVCTCVLTALAGPLCAQKTYTAASCNLSDVQAAINQELQSPVDGDIIAIPSGSCTWTGSTAVKGNFTRSVTIQGAGAVSSTNGGAGTTGSDKTVINDSFPGNGHTILSLSGAPGKTLRLTGIAVIMTGSAGQTNSGVVAFGSGTVRVDHGHWYTTSGNSILGFFGGTIGVADHNYFDSPSGSLTTTLALQNGETWNGDTGGYGDGSWADGDHWGSNLFMFIEDNRFHNGDLGDPTYGGRFVFRYNNVTLDSSSAQEGQMYSHGVTSARGRSVRAEEVYNNTWTAPGPPSAQHPIWSINGGTTLFWGNRITQFATMVQLDYVRKDNNVYPYAGVPSGWGNCAIGGNNYQVWDSAANSSCMDMAGRGQGDLLSGYPISSTVNKVTGTQSYPHQAISPVYIWGNTLVNVAYPVQNSGGYVQNRDYFTDAGSTGVRSGTLAARPSTCTTNPLAIPAGNNPGQAYWATDQNTLYVCSAAGTWTTYYTPYAYPHPLTQGSAAATKPSAPANLVTSVN
jgi:hypothetical protein